MIQLLLAVMVGGVASIGLMHVLQRDHGTFGFAVELLLGSIAFVGIMLHLLSQRMLVRQVSSALMAASQYINRLESFSLIDPQTQLFDRSYLDHLFNQQLKWLNRCGKSALLIVFQADPHNQRLSSDEMIVESARLLRSNFRGSDYIVRNSRTQFLVLLPDTNEQQAQFALNRLADKTEVWNLENNGSEILMRYEMTSCGPGGNMWKALEETENKLRQPPVAAARQQAVAS
ncbi:MAG: GGDEF domain-containing protein [Acidobacteriota bacterium]|nr:GGDEF domain-containing protein [Acidobacteriota bacterium]